MIGTFKTSPKFYYQHYIIHGKYRESWPLPAMYSFLSGKSYADYDLMISHLKLQAEEENLVLKPEQVH